MYNFFDNHIFQILDAETVSTKKLQEMRLQKQIDKEKLKLSFWKNKILNHARSN